MPIITIKSGREKSLLRKHPWVFSGAVEDVRGNPERGQTVDILDSKGQFLARGAYSPISQIRSRVWTWDSKEQVDASFFRMRLQKAISSRMNLPMLRDTNAVRLVFGESDGLPGLIVDRYANMLVVQLLFSGIERWREEIAELLLECTGIEQIYERSDADVLALEGLPEKIGVLRGCEPPPRIEINEKGLKFWVDVAGGHKTGFYLDQRDNRVMVGALAHGRDVLDCFCYTGGFSAYALMGGASSVTAVDASASALALMHENLALNDLDINKVTFQTGDVFKVLRELRDRGRSFDLIILDPPKFAATVAQAERAARGYKDINLLALKLLRPGGYLATFSCSGGVSADLFQKIVAGAALDSGLDARILMRLTQTADHPVALNYPEGEYLKGL
ncbi:MAG: class I SAM-dependent rRNA methyltransferase, partial [Chloroflexota bacterium]